MQSFNLTTWGHCRPWHLDVISRGTKLLPEIEDDDDASLGFVTEGRRARETRVKNIVQLADENARN